MPQPAASGAIAAAADATATIAQTGGIQHDEITYTSRGKSLGIADESAAMITDSEFIAAADRTLAAIGEALDAALADSEVDLDWSLNDGILEIECDDGSKIIVNRHVPNREIWVAARVRRIPFPAARRALARHARRATSSARRSRALHASTQAGLRDVRRCRTLPVAAPVAAARRASTPRAARSSRRARAARAAWPGKSVSTSAQKRGEWLSSTRCATSCATM